jgi:superfamily II DNA or RNA helicase
MSNLSNLELPLGMSTSTNNLLEEFYVPCMSRSARFDRAAGYFSSAILALAPMAFADFFDRGGKIRLVASTQLTDLDSRAINESETPQTIEQLIEDLRSLSDDRAGMGNILLRIFSSLLSSELVELKFAFPLNGRGVFHDKYGVFLDNEGNRVSFVGSANETAFAWSGLHNHEQIEIFRSWNSGDLARIEDHEQSFARIWENKAEGFEVSSSKEFEAKLITLAPPEPLESLLIEFRKRASESVSQTPSVSAKQYTLRDYQKSALSTWHENGNRGIISFATGGGKTLTAIDAISEWLDHGPVLVLVPSSLLLDQWMSELRSWIPGVNILGVGGGNPKAKWSRDLYRFTQRQNVGKRVVVATYASASLADFRSRLDIGDHLLLVGDEVHRFGAPDTRLIAEWLEAGATLGLSATPIRSNDVEGTDAIFSFFGELLQPVYTLEDAIRDGVLVPYDYFIRKAPLHEDEQAEWSALSNRISREIASNDGVMTDRAKLLLIKRSRISKRAVSKASITAEIVSDQFNPQDRWLIYCESVSHVEEVRKALLAKLPSQATVMEFHSMNSTEHKRIISFFERNGGVVLAIKCLDEGIDIPIINKAIVLASSTNPREYIQRRGRVLRRHPLKARAQIWDLVTVDTDGQPIAATEVFRAREFAENSRNLAVKLELEFLSDVASKLSIEVEKDV